MHVYHYHKVNREIICLSFKRFARRPDVHFPEELDKYKLQQLPHFFPVQIILISGFIDLLIFIYARLEIETA